MRRAQWLAILAGAVVLATGALRLAHAQQVQAEVEGLSLVGGPDAVAKLRSSAIGTLEVGVLIVFTALIVPGIYSWCRRRLAPATSAPHPGDSAGALAPPHPPGKTARP